MIRLPKIPEFFRARKLDIIQRMKMRQILTITGIVVLLVFFGIAIATNMFNGGQKTKAAISFNCPVGPGVAKSIVSNLTGNDWETISVNSASGCHDGGDLTISGNVTVHFVGRSGFDSLTVTDGAIISHDSLIRETDYDTTNWNLTDSGRLKRVDLEITGNLSLLRGGSIRADGNGYEGSRVFALNGILLIPNDCDQDAGGCRHGDGFAGGMDGDTHNGNPISADGGGYGGVGGTGTIYRESIILPAYGGVDNFDSTLWPGSGGGAAKRHDPEINWWGNGAAGGGIIKISAGDIVTDGSGTISANGGSNTVYEDSIDGAIAIGGGGAGGSIAIRITKYSGTAVLLPTALGGVACTISNLAYSCSVPGNGVVVTQGVSSTSSILGMPVSAAGGSVIHPSRTDLIGGGGGGGRIYIYTERAAASIRKSLTAVQRDGESNTTFNPYAVRLGDVIHVKLEMNNVMNGMTIEDEILTKSGGGYFCEPILSTISATSVTTSRSDYTSGKVTWLTSNSAPSASFEYDCKIRN